MPRDEVNRTVPVRNQLELRHLGLHNLVVDHGPERQREADMREALLASVQLDLPLQTLGDDLARSQSHSNALVLHVLQRLLHLELQKWLKQRQLPVFGDPDSCVNYIRFELEVVVLQVPAGDGDQNLAFEVVELD